MSTIGDISPSMVRRTVITVSLPEATVKGRLDKYALEHNGLLDDMVVLRLGGITLPPLAQWVPCLIRGLDD